MNLLGTRLAEAYTDKYGDGALKEQRRQLRKEERQKELEHRRNNIENYKWKGPKQKVDGKLIQTEIKLIDASAEDLQKYYDHCDSMLYSQARLNPGRLVLMDILREQIHKCNAELLLRHLAAGCNGKQKVSASIFYAGLVELLNKPEYLEAFPPANYDKISIGQAIQLEPEFEPIPIKIVKRACLGNLGLFDRKKITLAFILELGVFPTQEERREFFSESKDRIENQIRDNLNIAPSINLHYKRGGLTYAEFRAMYHLRTSRFSDLTTIQLTTLRDKILPLLIEKVDAQADFWETKIKQIKQVCQLKGITLKEPSK